MHRMIIAAEKQLTEYSVVSSYETEKLESQMQKRIDRSFVNKRTSLAITSTKPQYVMWYLSITRPRLRFTKHTNSVGNTAGLRSISLANRLRKDSFCALADWSSRQLTDTTPEDRSNKLPCELHSWIVNSIPIPPRNMLRLWHLVLKPSASSPT